MSFWKIKMIVMFFWRKNENLSSKVDFVLKENVALKNKITSISKDLDVCLKKNEFLQNKIDSHVCHARVVSHTSPIACSTLSSSVKNDINILKKSMDCLGSTLSQCVVGYTRLESLFRKKQISSFHAHPPRHTHAPHGHHHTMYAHVYTCTHCGRKGHLTKFCFSKKYFLLLQNQLLKTSFHFSSK